MNNIEDLYAQNPDPRSFAEGYFEHLATVFKKMDFGSIEEFINLLCQARDRDSRIFFIGNGGSAATASHFANDLALGTKAKPKPFRAISLCDNTPVLTSIGNDFGFDQIFVRQLQYLLMEKDVLIAISASGNSPNVLKAVEYANSQGAITIGLTGFDGGKLKGLAKLNVHVPTEKGEYWPVEDIHMILDHLVASFLLNLFRMK